MTHLGFDYPPERVATAFRAAGAEFRPRWKHFEISGIPTSDDQIAGHLEELDRAVLKDLGISENHDALVERINTWFADGVHFELFSDVVAVLEELRQRKYRLAIVSNGSHQVENSRKLGIEHFFETIIGSIYVGYAKPMPEIYRMTLDALEIEPGEAVIVGDNYEWDVVGPEAVEIRGIHLVRDGSDSLAHRVIEDLRGILDQLDD